jgi:hypothetical protein
VFRACAREIYDLINQLVPELGLETREEEEEIEEIA